MATPPRRDGSVCPEVVYAAKRAGATHLLLAGGAQAVAAMAYGTATCPKVDTLLGPGNQYVTAAKMLNAEQADCEALLPSLTAAGSIFLGRWTPESVGDYASGTNHVLPTYGYARMYSGVSLDTFLKHITVQALTREGLGALGPSVVTMARTEGLEAHARAVSLRLGLP